MKRKIAFVVGCVALLSLLSANAATFQVQVGAGGLKFTPQNVDIQVGDTVEWTWESNDHSATSGTAGNPDGLFDSGILNRGATFSFTFTEAGVINYYCTPHGTCCGMIGTVTVGQGTPTPTPTPTATPPVPLIERGPIKLSLTTVASGLTAPVDATTPPDGSGRLIIVQQTGKAVILKDGSILSTPFIDVTDRLVDIMPGYDERGFLGLTFHPDFNNSSAPGYRKIYTFTSEPVGPRADFTVPDPVPFDCQTVIAEWQVSASDPNVVDPASRREVMRIDKPQFNHNGGHLAFRATDHYLYIVLGDGGNANDVGDGHDPKRGNAQNKNIVLGKLLRIDPLDPALTTGSPDPISANGKYRIPVSNPFLTDDRAIGEIYAYGLRNPFRFSFDAPTDQLIIGDVGQNNIEEVDIGVAGANYGWNKKEGTFLFNPLDGTITVDPFPRPKLTEPVAQYSHSDGIAIIGGEVYRGASLPVLSGKYVFGDLGGASGELTNGRLFYTNLSSGTIREFRGAGENLLKGFLKGFGTDASNEIYVLIDTNIGPSGTGGSVLKITGATSH